MPVGAVNGYGKPMVLGGSKLLCISRRYGRHSYKCLTRAGKGHAAP